MALIRRIVKEQRIAAVMTMHDLNMALRYVDQTLFLKDGVIHAMAAPDEVSPAVIEQVYGLPVCIHQLEIRRTSSAPMRLLLPSIPWLGQSPWMAP